MLGSIRYTFRLMRKHPFRSILTTIQIALGFWVIATIFNMNIQANNEIKDESATLNANLAQTYISDENFHPLTLTELDIFVENSSSIDTAFTYQYYGTVDIQHDDYTYNLYGLVETSATSPQLLELELIDGNFFTPQDIRAQNRVVLISERMNRMLFQGKKGIGQTIMIKAFLHEDYLPFTIIGIYKDMSFLLTSFFRTQPTMLIPDGTRLVSAADVRIRGSEVFLVSDDVYAAVQEVEQLYGPRFTTYFNHIVTRRLNDVKGITIFLAIFGFIAVINNQFSRNSKHYADQRHRANQGSRFEKSIRGYQT